MSHAQWKIAPEGNALEERSPEMTDRARRRLELDLAWDIGQAVYDRRKALGIAQTELARRARTTRPRISKLELGGTIPTVPLLTRLARAMDSAFSLEVEGTRIRVAFTAHPHPTRNGAV